MEKDNRAVAQPRFLADDPDNKNPTTATSVFVDAVEYDIRPGDTIASIASAVSCTIQDILKLNARLRHRADAQQTLLVVNETIYVPAK